MASDTVPCQLALVLQQALTHNRKSAEQHLGGTVTATSMEEAKKKIKAHMGETKRPLLGKTIKRGVK